MDVEQIADELYGLKPGDFTAARDAYVAEARRAKDTAAAKAVAALRKPTLAAWAANQLARRQPEEAQRVLALGETLREAHRTLDGDQLRAASRQQHQLVTTLARTAAGLAGEAGQSVSDTVLHEVEQTLHAVLARPDVAERWATGRLVKVPEAAVGFTEITPETVPVRPAQAKPRRSAPKKSRDPEGDRRLRDLESARTTAADADVVVGRREKDLSEARAVHEAAEGQAEEATGRFHRLERELQEARKARSAAGASVAEAGRRVTAAERALRDARRTAEQAADAVQRLEQQTDQ
ncbi:hypothetical protein [Streptomyces sp. NPDC002057]|uniref:hypothetical protein n=1 Tax=Streptomyces sp. NPDC002057 TaxID=3154664 RepID=UPI00331FA020